LQPLPYETPAALASAIHKGDRNAEAVLYKQYYPATLYLLERRTGNKDLAQDLCHEAFCVLIERLRAQTLEQPEKLAGFLYNIAINVQIADLRKTIRRNTAPNSDLMDRVADNRQNQYRELLRERTGKAVRSLIDSMRNSRDRRLLYGYFIEEKDKEEICQELDLSQRHFDRVLFRAKQRFKDLITGGSNG
jgi:RNA polymerase sigma-70 factor (ECF subfamily)